MGPTPEGVADMFVAAGGARGGAATPAGSGERWRVSGGIFRSADQPPANLWQASGLTMNS